MLQSYGVRGRSDLLPADRVADIDQIVGNYPEADPALHPVITAISTTVQAVPSLAHADAPLAPGAPSLPVAEPALLLLTFTDGALVGAIGNADPFDTSGVRCDLVLGGIKAGIGGD